MAHANFAIKAVYIVKVQLQMIALVVIPVFILDVSIFC